MNIKPISDTEQKILDSCDEVFPEVIDFIKEMVKQYGVLNQEQGVLNVVEKTMQDLGMAPIRVNIPDNDLQKHPLYAPVDWDYENKYNLVSTLNPEAEGRKLIFNGHIDVVPATPFDMWSQMPMEPWEKDGWLYGRGAADMQAGVAAMIYAAHAIKRIGLELDKPLTIQAVVEEECTGNGALACLHQGYGGDFVLIPEPFGATIYTGQVGVLWFKVSVSGKPVHVEDTSAGENAIEAIYKLIPYFKALEVELNERFRKPPYDRFEHPFNLSIGKIKGGDWASSVPAHAELEARIGFPPGMTSNEIMQMVSDRLEQACNEIEAFKTKRPKLRFSGFRSEGHLVDTTNPGISLLQECHRSLTHAEPEEFLATCTTDLRAFHFYSKTSGTCYGPIGNSIHGVDEGVDIESVRHVLKAYALFASRW